MNNQTLTHEPTIREDAAMGALQTLKQELQSDCKSAPKSPEQFCPSTQIKSLTQTASEDIHSLGNKFNNKEFSEEAKDSPSAFFLSQGVPSTCPSNQSNLSGDEGEDASSMGLQRPGPLSIPSDTFSCNLSPEKKDYQTFSIKSIRNLYSDLEECQNENSINQAECKPAPEVASKVSTTRAKPAHKPSNLKGLLREFKKFFIKDFRSFEKEVKNNSNNCKDQTKLDQLRTYIEARLPTLASVDATSEKGSTRGLDYSLGLLINPKFVLNCFSNSSASSKESKILIQDLLLK